MNIKNRNFGMNYVLWEGREHETDIDKKIYVDSCKYTRYISLSFSYMDVKVILMPHLTLSHLLLELIQLPRWVLPASLPHDSMFSPPKFVHLIKRTNLQDISSPFVVLFFRKEFRNGFVSLVEPLNKHTNSHRCFINSIL